MPALERLTPEECYLFAILEDHSGLDLAEFAWFDPTSKDGFFRAHPYQVPWWRHRDQMTIEMSARSIGKTLGIVVRAFYFPFGNPGQEMLITAPEMTHLDPVTNLVERKFASQRLGREIMKKPPTHKPHFLLEFKNNSRIMGRIPGRLGTGVKGQHPLVLEQDEAQDYPEPGWTELVETLKRGEPHAARHVHGVTIGVGNEFHRLSAHALGEPDLRPVSHAAEGKYTVFRIPAMASPLWTDEERESKMHQYPDESEWRRNIRGLPGEPLSPLFRMSALARCHPVGTPVLVGDSDEHRHLPIEDVEVGMTVPHAMGHGRVRQVMTSWHQQLVKYVLDNGEPIFCSLDHPVFTQRGWVEASQLRPGDALFTASQVATQPRVASVGVLERGSPEFDRLSGGSDSVLCYDLTVDGHPSFYVGQSEILVHNCTEDDQSNPFNVETYWHPTINDHDLDPDQQNILDFLQKPEAHQQFRTIWMGMDIGLLNDPTEILIAAEEQVTPEQRKELIARKKACPKPGVSRLIQIGRVTLKKIKAPSQAMVIAWLCENYPVKRFAMDSTGIGLPIFQTVQFLSETDGPWRAGAKKAMSVIQGYNFSENILVAFDERIELDTERLDEKVKKQGLQRNVKEWSTDICRLYLDEERYWFPWDVEMLKQLQASKYRFKRDAFDDYGRRKRAFTQGEDHCLDALRMLLLGHSQMTIDTFLAQEEEHIQEVFIEGGGFPWFDNGW